MLESAMGARRVWLWVLVPCTAAGRVPWVCPRGNEESRPCVRPRDALEVSIKEDRLGWRLLQRRTEMSFIPIQVPLQPPCILTLASPGCSPDSRSHCLAETRGSRCCPLLPTIECQDVALNIPEIKGYVIESWFCSSSKKNPQIKDLSNSMSGISVMASR